MADLTRLSNLDVIRRELAEKSRQLSELEVILADYHAERIRLIRDLRRLQAQLRNAEEQLPPRPPSLGVR